MSRFILLGIIAILITSSQISYAMDAPRLREGMSYQQVSSWHEQFLEGEPSRHEMRAAYRDIIRFSPIGERGLNNVYKNFSANSLDPTIPGVDRTILMQMSASPQQRKGYRREWLYADSIFRDGRFEVVALDQPISTEFGRTDKDLVLRHRQSGAAVRIEVKDVSVESQIRNADKLKRQIDNMGREYKITGERQIWLNRRPVSANLSAHAASRGVVSMGNVRTGIDSRSNQMAMRSALDLIDKDIQTSTIASSQRRASVSFLSNAQLGAGAGLLYSALPEAVVEARRLAENSVNGTSSWSALGQHSALALAGGSMMLSGGANIGKLYVGSNLTNSLAGLGYFGGLSAAGFLLASEGFNIARYRSGEISPREFWTQKWMLGSTVVGATLGSWLGSTVSIFTIGDPTSGGTIGSIVGALAGTVIGETTSNLYYDRNFQELDREFGNAIYARYGL